MDQPYSSSFTYRHETLIFLLARQPLASCATFSLPIAEICQRGDASREELLTALGPGALVNGWKITFDRPSERILYEKSGGSTTDPMVILGPREAPVRSVIAAATPKPPLDSQAVGDMARAFADAEFAEGREVSASEAVAHVLGKRG